MGLFVKLHILLFLALSLSGYVGTQAAMADDMLAEPQNLNWVYCPALQQYIGPADCPIQSDILRVDNLLSVPLESTMPITVIQEDLFGASVANLGDLDGDGVTDIAVGAPGHLISNITPGDLHILFMNIDGSVMNNVEIDEMNNDFDLSDGDHFGQSVANLGDLDGDGVTDIAVGAPGHLVGEIGTGDLYVIYLNNDGSVKQTAEINGETTNGPELGNRDLFGQSVANLGDLDGDGVTDIAVGAPDHTVDGIRTGTVYVIFLNEDGGAKGTVEINSMEFAGLDSLNAHDKFGHSIANIGDLDGDGVTDIAVGAPGHLVGEIGTGDLYVIYLNNDGSVKQTAEINGDTPNGPVLEDHDLFGQSVANLGDLDGDGVTDIAVGAPGHLVGEIGTGDLYVIYLNNDGSVKQTAEINGDPLLNGPELEDQGNLFGSSVAGLGDLDGDGRPDIAIGGFNSAYVVFTSDRASITGTVFSDINNNGVMDVGESGIRGHRILAIDYATLEVTQAYTEADGTYAFNNVSPAPATILLQSHVYPEGHVLSPASEWSTYVTPLSYQIHPLLGGTAPASEWSTYVTPGQGSITTFDVAFYPVHPSEMVTLDVVVYEDNNLNGLMDTGEFAAVGLDDFYVYPYIQGPDKVHLPNATDANGRFTAQMLPVDFGLHANTVSLESAGYIWATTNYMRDDGVASSTLYDYRIPLIRSPAPGSTHTVMVGLTPQSDLPSGLTPAESEYLETKGIINVGYEPDWRPIEYIDDNGQLAGLTAWYIEQIEDYSGANMETVDGIDTWTKALQGARDGTIDVMMMIVDTEERRDYLDFTEPHFIMPTDMITNGPMNIDNSDLSGYTIATVEQFAVNSWLTENHPGANQLSHASVELALRSVVDGNADMYIDPLLVTSFEAEEHGIEGLVSSGESGYSYELSVGVAEDMPELFSIMEKALASISPKERDAQVSSLSGLTPAESAWLENNSIINVGYEPDWRPIEYIDDNGQLAGLTAWYIEQIEDYSGANMETVDGIDTWTKALQGARDGTIDVMMMIVDTEERRDYLDFTEPHFIMPTDMITNGPMNIDNSDLSGYTIATVEQFAVNSWLTENHPGANQLSHASVELALRSVVDGNADMYIDPLLVTSFEAEEHGIEGLVSSGESGYSYELSVGVAEDMPELFSIMEKALASISPKERDAQVSSLSGLTPAESAWLENNSIINVGYEPDWRPIEYIDDNGQLAGLTAWYIEQIEDYSGANMETVDGIDTWTKALQGARDGTIDVMMMIVDTEERRDYLDFTEPHFIMPTDMITNGPMNIDNSDLSGYTIATVEQFAVNSWLTENHPGANQLSHASVELALRSVVDGNADMYIDPLLVTSFEAEEHGIEGLVSSGESGYSYELSVGVAEDMPELFSIMEKALASISPKERDAQVSSLSGLTPAESAWLENNSIINVGYEPDWRPIEYIDDNGQLAGLTAWYIEQIEDYSGANMETVDGIDTWTKALQGARDGTIDVMMMIVDTEERRDYLDFTEPHFIMPTDMITNGPMNIDNSDLSGYTIATVEQFAVNSWLTENHPGANQLSHASVELALRSVVDGNADMYIDPLLVTSFEAEEHGIEGLVSSGESGYSYELSVGVAEDMPELFSIMEKALASISPKERDAQVSSLSGLTPAESAWLENNSIINVGYEPDWRPIEYIDDNGQLAGLTAWYIEQIEDYSGANMETVDGIDTWTKALQGARDGTIDVMMMIVDTEERRDYLDFTEPHFIMPTDMITNGPMNIDNSDLSGYTIATVEQFAVNSWLTENHPGANQLSHASVELALRSVVDGNADMYIDPLLVTSFEAEEHGIEGLVSSGESGYSYELSVGVAEDMPELFSIMEKALASISPKERDAQVSSLSGLTPAESAWLENNSIINVGYEPDWRPIEYIDDNGQLAGLTAWYIEQIEDYSGANMETVDGIDTWTKALQGARDGTIDVMMMIVDTEERRDYLDFTEPHFIMPTDMITNGPMNIDNSDLSGYTIATVEQFAVNSWLTENHPGANQLSHASVELALRSVVDGNADMYIDPLLVTSFEAEEHGIEGLVSSGESGYSYELSVGVAEDMPELFSIMEKALASISPKERDAQVSSLSGLTPAESAWLENNSIINVGYEPDWRPIEYIDDNGQLAGLTAWYIEQIEDYSGANMETVDGIDTWTKALQGARDGTIDVMMMIVDTEERRDYLDFTEPHFIMPTDMITNGPMNIDNSDLSGYTIATVEQFAVNSWLTENHPGANQLSHASVELALRSVVDGNADMYIDPLLVTSFEAEEHGIEGLVSSGESGYSYELSVGVAEDMPELFSIMEKALASISPKERDAQVSSLSGLTPAESAWLENNSIINVGYEPDWRPIEYIDDNGQLAGLTAWYIEQIEDYSGANMETVDGIDTWTKALQGARDGTIDVMMMIVDTEERRDYLDFTEPHFIMPTDMITNGPMNIDNSDLSGYTIATVEQFAVNSWLTENHPGANQLSHASVELALRSVVDGNADMYIDPLLVTSFEAEEHGIEGLVSSGESGYSYELSVGVAEDMPELFSIMEKALASISPKEREMQVDMLSNPTS